MYTSERVIYERNGYGLTSYGRGAAYLLTHFASGKSVWLQDDDAAQLRDDFERAYEIGDSAIKNLFGSYQGVMS